MIEIRTLAGHPMETGFRRTQLGELIPRDIIRTLVCTYNGVEVFRADLHPAIAANPLITFTTVATESGTLEFRWTGDNGFSATQTRGDQGRLRFCFIVLLCLGPAMAGRFPLSERRSGYEFMSRETRAMQDDEVTGPAVLWLLDGEALWGKLGCTQLPRRCEAPA